MSRLHRWIIAALENFGSADDRAIIDAIRSKFWVAESTVRGARLTLQRAGSLKPVDRSVRHAGECGD